MRAYYLEGDNIEWLIGVCLILFVIGVVGALAMFVIPEKINLRVCRANVFFFSEKRRKPSPNAGGDIRRKARGALKINQALIDSERRL